MTSAAAVSANEIYEAVITLSRSISGRTDLRSLLAGVAESIWRIVKFDHVALILHDAGKSSMQGYILNAPGNPIIESLELPVEEDPAGWVWLNQKPLIISPLHSETRWPEFVKRARDFGIGALTLVPLTAGDNRLGALGFSSVAPSQPGTAELAFLERVATEFAVAVESFLAKQTAIRECDRLRTLFDIMNALVSKLSPDELFPEISEQVSNIVRHDHAMLTLRNEATGLLDVYALHSTDAQLLDAVKGPFNPEGMPAAEVLATGKPVVARDIDADRYPNPNFRGFVSLGMKSICSVPLIIRDRTIGTLALSRIKDDVFTQDAVEFLAQVANQIAIAVDNSLSYRALTELKDRLATEKLYLEDEIRLDHNIGNMVGVAPAF